MAEISEAEGYKTLPDAVLEARIRDFEAHVARGNTDARLAESLRLLKAERDRRGIDGKAQPPQHLNATVWLHQNADGSWFAAAKVGGHTDLFPISDELASLLKDTWPVA